jgi:hypothetical protein
MDSPLQLSLSLAREPARDPRGLKKRSELERVLPPTLPLLREGHTPDLPLLDHNTEDQHTDQWGWGPGVALSLRVKFGASSAIWIELGTALEPPWSQVRIPAKKTPAPQKLAPGGVQTS